jgi:hypothetical protein
MGDGRAEACWGGGRMRGHRPIVGGESDDKKINNIKYIVAFGGRWSIILHTTTNQKWTGAGEERVEKRDEHGVVAEECQCTMSACGRREGGMYRIVDDCKLLSHDAEHHDPNTVMTASKKSGKLDLPYRPGFKHHRGLSTRH